MNIPEFCASYANDLFWWGKAFVTLAFFAALVGVLATVIDKIREVFSPPDAGDKRALAAGTGPKVILDAVKGLVEALAKAPAWFAMFLAGLALIWLALNPTPGICAKQETTPASQPAEPDSEG